MTPSTASFWRDLASRAVRNAVQVAVPFLALVAAGHVTKAGAATTVAAVVLAGALSAAKTLAGLTADPTAPLWTQALERAVGAAAGAVAAMLPLDLTGAISADWGSIGVAAAGAAALSLATWLIEGTTPPANAALPPRQASTGPAAGDL